MAGTRAHVTTRDGVRLFFEKAGNGGKPLIVLNGFYLVEDFEYLAHGRTVIFLDLRNRGRSDYVTDEARLTRGVLNDVDDIETVRRHFGAGDVDLLAHSYAAKTVILYAVRHSTRVGRIVQIGAPPADEGKDYPPHLKCADATLEEFFDRAARLQEERSRLDSRTYCERFWSILRTIYVADPRDAGKIRWDHCHLPTESHLEKYWLRHLAPSLRAFNPTAKELEGVRSPVLVVHGTRDRSAPYGGAREWAMALPNARLLTIGQAAHAPWIEAPEQVLGPIETFLDGAWPDAAERVSAL